MYICLKLPTWTSWGKLQRSPGWSTPQAIHGAQLWKDSLFQLTEVVAGIFSKIIHHSIRHIQMEIDSMKTSSIQDGDQRLSRALIAFSQALEITVSENIGMISYNIHIITFKLYMIHALQASWVVFLKMKLAVFLFGEGGFFAFDSKGLPSFLSKFFKDKRHMPPLELPE